MIPRWRSSRMKSSQDAVREGSHIRRYVNRDDGARPLSSHVSDHSLTHSPTLAERGRGVRRRAVDPTPSLRLHGLCTTCGVSRAACARSSRTKPPRYNRATMSRMYALPMPVGCSSMTRRSCGRTRRACVRSLQPGRLCICMCLRGCRMQPSVR